MAKSDVSNIVKEVMKEYKGWRPHKVQAEGEVLDDKESTVKTFVKRSAELALQGSFLPDLITKKDFDELRHFKKTFETSLKAYSQAWKRIDNKKVKVQWSESIRQKVPLNVTHYDYAGFSKKQLEFFNFLVIEKLRSKLSPEEKHMLHKLNKELVSRIDTNPCCPKCGSGDTQKDGSRKNKLGLVQTFCCKNCGVVFSFGRMNQDWQVIIAIVELHFAGYASRKIAPEILHKYQKFIHWNTVCKFLKLLKPYLKPRSIKLSEFDAWIKNCVKCDKPLQKKILNFNFCPDCDTEIVKAFKNLHKKLLEENLYAVPENKAKRY